MKALAAVITLLTLCSPALLARPNDNLTSGASGTPAAEQAGSSGQTLFEKTLPSDIDTASYYELLAWVRRLGLSEKGSRSELQQRLRAYYKLPAPAQGPAANDTNQRIITVKSARSAEYFTIEKVNQKYIRLSGGVDLEMYDPKTKTTHSITADTIVFNQTEKTITATGHIEYLLTGNQKKEVFQGKSLTFNVDNWNGIFFQGVSQSQKTIDKNQLTFSYSGNTIHRLGNDIVTLNDGTITSSEALPPNYKVTASRIWVLAPGEWALSNAVLYLGRVPILYFPFFFHPGDNLFFHPAVGYRDEEGYYLQTTTYLLGRRSKVNSSLSFLQVAEDTNVQYNTKIRGLFLRKTTPVSSAEQSAAPYNTQDSYVKLLFDIYSRLGVFAGIESKIVDLGILKSLQANLSIARSRNIFREPEGYTQFLQRPDGTFTSLWNSSNLFGLTLPIRYGADLEFNLTDPSFTFTGSIPFYSDPYYLKDFGNRSESIDWSRILGLSGSTTTSSTTQTTTQTQGLSSLLWSLHASVSPDTSALKPYVSQAAITSADMSMYWQTRTRSTTGVVGLDPNLPNYIPGGLSSSSASDFYFPDSQFFYPQSYILPSVSAKIAGTIFSNNPSTSTQKPASPTTGSASTPPTGSSSTSAAATKAEAQGASSTATQNATASDRQTAGEGSAPSPTAKPPAGSGSAPSSAPTTQPKVVIPARPPWETFSKPPEKAQSTLKVPQDQPDVPISAPPVLSNYVQSLSYAITPAASIENRTVNDGWLTPDSVNLANAYSILNTRGSGSLTYNGALAGKLMSIQNTTALSGNYKIHYNRLPAVTDWEAFLLQDYNSTFLKATNSVILTSFPFQGSELLAGTNLKYLLTTDLFSRDWVANSAGPVYQDSFLTWDSSHVSAHSLTTTLDLAPWQQHQTMSLNFVLPPLEPEIDYKAVSHAGFLTTTVSGTITKPKTTNTWTFQPMTLEGSLNPFAWVLLDEQLVYNFLVPSWQTSTTKLSFFNKDKSINASETFIYDLQNHYPTDSITSLKLWFFTAQFEAKRSDIYQFAFPAGWTSTGQQKFVPSNLALGISYDYKSKPLWKNRIQLETNLNTAWNLNLLQFTDNALTLDLTAKLSIYKFLDVSFSLKSQDRATYRYFPSYAAEVGQTPLNPLVDLLKSINIFNRADRTASNFKMQQVDFKLVHHLEDWNLNMEFTGSPELASSVTGPSYYKWNPTFTLSVDWKPVPEIKSNIQVQNGQVSF